MSEIEAALIERNRTAIGKAGPLFEKLNGSWERIEAFFRKQGILRPTQITVEYLYDARHNPPNEAYGGSLLGIERINGAWRVCVGNEHYDYPDDSVNWIPISDAPTDVRLRMLEKIPDLFAKLTKSNEEYLSEIERGVVRAESIVTQLFEIAKPGASAAPVAPGPKTSQKPLLRRKKRVAPSDQSLTKILKELEEQGVDSNE